MPTPSDTFSLTLNSDQYFALARLLLTGRRDLDKQTDRNKVPCKGIRAAVIAERKLLHEIDDLMDGSYTASGRLVNDLGYWEGVHG